MRQSRETTSRFITFSWFFFQDEEGQAITEYILILSMALVGAVALVRGLSSILDSGILRLGGQLEKDLKTGRAPLSVWRN